MALSGSYDFDLTCTEICTEALELNQAVAAGETPSAEDITTTRRTFNLMIKAWQADDIGIWLQTIVNFTLTADKESYTIGKVGTEDIDEPRPLDIIEARIRDATSGLDTPLEIITRQEYLDFPDKSTSGTPSSLYYDPQQTSGVIYVWQPSDNSTDSIYFTAKNPVQDLDSITNNANFPQEWLLAITTNLAVRVAPKFGKVVSQDLRRQAEIDFLKASGWDREHGSVYFARERR